jgi:integral membrane sensor domain MASE1
MKLKQTIARALLTFLWAGCIVAVLFCAMIDPRILVAFGVAALIVWAAKNLDS